MATIEKKCWPVEFEAVCAGKKRYDFRVADFPCEAGDTLLLREWNPETKDYTGRTVEKKIGYVGTFSLDYFGQKKDLEDKGFLMLSLE